MKVFSALLVGSLALTACSSEADSAVPEPLAVAQAGDRIELPKPAHRSERSLEATLYERRSVRQYAGESLS